MTRKRELPTRKPREKRPTTVKTLRQQIAMLESQLASRERVIATLKEHQRQLTEALVEWNRWAGRMKPSPNP